MITKIFLTNLVVFMFGLMICNIVQDKIRNIWYEYVIGYITLLSFILLPFLCIAMIWSS